MDYCLKGEIYILNKFFKFDERQTTLSTEIIAGMTTFVTMVYIVIISPALMSKAGMDFNGVFIATVLVTIVGTLFMGVIANYPIAIAPGMALISYFVFSVVLLDNIPWQKALGCVFIASVIFMLFSLTKIRNELINAIPTGLKHSITAGIGLFIAFIGLQNSKLIVDSPATLVTLGSLQEPIAALTLVGLIFTLILMSYNVRGAIFISMIGIFVLSYIFGLVTIPAKFFAFPTGLEKTAMQLDIKGVFDDGLFAIVFTFFLITLFDTTGTMLGVADKAGLMQDGKFKNAKTALFADALGSTLGGLLGSSPTSAYIESGAGVAAGGRTGFTAVVIALLFGVTLFFAPVAQMISAIPSVTAPALIITGFLMMEGLKHIDWTDITEGFPAFLVLILMPLTYSIAVAIGIGFIVYPLLKMFGKKANEVHPIMYVLQIIFLFQLLFIGL